MNGFLVILKVELFSLFISPATYVASFYFLSLLAFGFRFFIESFAASDWILPPLSSLALGLILGGPALIPFLTMRSFAEERRLGTLETLMSAPISSVSLVYGKWTASYLFFCFVAVCAFCFPLILWICFPDQGEGLGFQNFEQWAGSGIFLLTFGGSFSAIGIFSSSITKNQMVAGMLSFTLLTLYLSLMALSFGESHQSDSIVGVSSFLKSCMGSMYDGLNKLQNFSVGLVEISTIFHQIAVIIYFLSLATLQVERLKH